MDGRLTITESMNLSVALTTKLDVELQGYLDRTPDQEDLVFALWRPSKGLTRTTAMIDRLIYPQDGDRYLHGNVAFTSDYVWRALQEARGGYGIALLHNHFSPGWQDLSEDDVRAERDRLAGAVYANTGLPLVGLTKGSDGAWSGRFWTKSETGSFQCQSAATVRVVGRNLQVTYHPVLQPPPQSSPSQIATVSVWGEAKQSDLVRLHVGVVGLGSVGSIVAETLSRLGCRRITLIDHDLIEERNLDRTLGSTRADIDAPKVSVSRRLLESSYTASTLDITDFKGSLLEANGLLRAMDCDVLFSCVDRPFPRHVLNALAYAHLIPVIDGGIFARVKDSQLLHATWRIHTVGPGRSCMMCLDALRREDVSLDMEGKLDDPVYIEGLGPDFDPLLARQNVVPFSLSVAAHEVLQFIGLATGEVRIGGTGPQSYHCYPGIMEIQHVDECIEDCEYNALTAQATDLSGNLVHARQTPDYKCAKL